MQLQLAKLWFAEETAFRKIGATRAGLWQYGKDIMKVFGEYLGRRETKHLEVGENYVMRSFIIRSVLQILV
jgi:hypothetical protein